MEYVITTTNLVVSAIAVILVFWVGFWLAYHVGKGRGARDLVAIANSLWLMKSGRNKVDEKLEDIEKAIESIQRGSE